MLTRRTAITTHSGNPDTIRTIRIHTTPPPKGECRSLAEIGVADIPTIGLAERQEEVVFGDGRPNLLLPRDSEALFVLTRLRDEAHRFAITYHRNRREKHIRESVLDEVSGIGEAKKLRLLKRFRSVYGIARASAEEIAAVAGVNLATAAEVLRRVNMV